MQSLIFATRASFALVLGRVVLVLYLIVLVLSRVLLVLCHVVQCYTRVVSCCTCAVSCCVVLYLCCVVLSRVILVLCCVLSCCVVLSRVVTRVVFQTRSLISQVGRVKILELDEVTISPKNEQSSKQFDDRNDLPIRKKND